MYHNTLQRSGGVFVVAKLQIQSYRFDFNHIGIVYFQHKRAIFSVKTITFPVSVVFGIHFVWRRGKMEIIEVQLEEKNSPVCFPLQ